MCIIYATPHAMTVPCGAIIVWVAEYMMNMSNYLVHLRERTHQVCQSRVAQAGM